MEKIDKGNSNRGSPSLTWITILQTITIVNVTTNKLQLKRMVFTTLAKATWMIKNILVI